MHVLQFYVLFSSISIILGRWVGDNARLYIQKKQKKKKKNKASQAIQSRRTVPFFLLVSLLDGYSFPNVHVKGIVAFKH